MTDARTGAIRRNTEAINRLASAQEEVARQMHIANMLAAAQFSTTKLSTSQAYQKALHNRAINLIGVRP